MSALFVKKTSDKKQATKTSDKQLSTKTLQHKAKVIAFLTERQGATTKELASQLGLSVQRTRAILAEMNEVEAQGTSNNDRSYRLKS